MSDTPLLSEHVRDEIEHWKSRFPADRQRSAVIGALHAVQHENEGYLTTELMDAVAEYLELPNIQVYEVATFYSMYEHKPVGKHKICVCTNISCKLRGSDEIVEHLQKRLGIGLGQTTQDGKFTLKEVECLGACIGAPMCQIGKDYHEHLTPESLDKLLDGLE